MSLGQRIRQARVKAELSVRGLADKVGVSATATSKYERDLDIPRPAVIVRLAKQLGVTTDYFLRETSVLLECPAFRCREDLNARVRGSIEAAITEFVEDYLQVEEALPDFVVSEPLPRYGMISDLSEAETAAENLRSTWNLGSDPIDNVADCLEDHGIKVTALPKRDGFDGYCCWANETIPVIAYAAGCPGDRQRFTQSHELAHLLLSFASQVDEERFAHRFAGAFLAPADYMVRKIGAHRSDLSLDELYLLKHELGMSMQSIIHRAYDLSIIKQSVYQKLMNVFQSSDWRIVEFGEQIQEEKPIRFSMLVHRCIAEGTLTPPTASRLLKETLRKPPIRKFEITEEMAREYSTNKDVRSMRDAMGGINEVGPERDSKR